MGQSQKVRMRPSTSCFQATYLQKAEFPEKILFSKSLFRCDRSSFESQILDEREQSAPLPPYDRAAHRGARTLAAVACRFRDDKRQELDDSAGLFGRRRLLGPRPLLCRLAGARMFETHHRRRGRGLVAVRRGVAPFGKDAGCRRKDHTEALLRSRRHRGRKDGCLAVNDARCSYTLLCPPAIHGRMHTLTIFVDKCSH